MISGYYYKAANAPKQIKKIAILFGEANFLYCMWRLFNGAIFGNFPVINIQKILSFILLNESPFSGHLWYLRAILYTTCFVYLADKRGYKRYFYYIAPVLLIIDLLFGKYSLLIFGREFPTIWVRNWLFVGIPYVSIGMYIKERGLRIGWWGIPMFISTTFFERYLLLSAGVNATRDQYISTTFLAISIFSFVLEYKGEICNGLAKIGRDYSAWVYIIHPILVTCCGFVFRKLGLQEVWGNIGPIVIFVVSVFAVATMTKVKNMLFPNRSNKSDGG